MRDFIADLVARGEQLDGAWERASSAAPYWTGIGRHSFNRFDLDEILDHTTELSARYRQLDAAIRRLDDFKIAGLEYPDALPALIHACETAIALDKTPALALLPSLLAHGIANALQTFVEACEAHATQARELAPVFRDEITEATLAALGELESICREHEIAGLDEDTLEHAVISKRQAAAMARRLAEQVRPFAEQMPGSENWRFSDIGAIRKLLTHIGTDVVHRRSPTLADPAAIDLLKTFNENGRQLRRDWQELESHFTSHDLTSVEELADAVAALRDAGPFAFLSGSYRRAAKLYRRIAKAKFKRGEADGHLERLMSWKRREGCLRPRQPGDGSSMASISRALIQISISLNALPTYYTTVRVTFVVDRAEVRCANFSSTATPNSSCKRRFSTRILKASGFV